MDLKELKKLLHLLKKEGVQAFEQEGIKLHFSPDAFIPDSTPATSSPSVPQEPTYSDLDTLFWSSPGVGHESEGSH